MAESRNSEDRPDEPGSEGRPDDAGADEQSDEARDEARSDENEGEDRPDDTGEDEDQSDADGDGDGDRSDSERITGTSPSGADISKLEKFEPSEEAKQSEPSKEDAMGQDKRRQVVGESYGPSKSRQFMFFGIVAVVLIVIVGGFLALVAAFDKPPTVSNTAPWSKTQTDPQLAAQQNATPIAPSSPCGEPGNEFPTPPESPCAPPSKANGNQGSNFGDPTNVTGVSKAQ